MSTRHRPPVQQSDIVESLQRWMMFAQDGGNTHLRNYDLGDIDGRPGPKTGGGLVRSTGKSRQVLDRLKPEEVNTFFSNHMQLDQTWRESVIRGLQSGIQTKPDEVRTFLAERGRPVTGNDLSAAVNSFADWANHRDPAPIAPPAPSAPEAPPAPSDPYAGIVFEQRRARTEVINGRDGTVRFRVPEGTSDSAIERADIRGRHVYFDSADQTDGIRDKGRPSPNSPAGRWYSQVEPGSLEARRGIATMDDGKLYIALEENGELIRRRIDPYVGQNGQPGPFAGIPFNMHGPDSREVRNCFEALQETLPNFNSDKGMLLRGKNDVTIIVTEQNGRMNMELVDPNNPQHAARIAAAGAQTPREITENWYKDSTFNNYSRTQEVVRGSGIRLAAEAPAAPKPKASLSDTMAAAAGSVHRDGDPTTAVGAETKVAAAPPAPAPTPAEKPAALPTPT